MSPQTPGAAFGRLAFAPPHWSVRDALGLCAPAASRLDWRNALS